MSETFRAQRPMSVMIPREFVKHFEEVRILFPPYPGLLVIDMKMLDRVRELMRQPEIAEQYELMLVPKG